MSTELRTQIDLEVERGGNTMAMHLKHAPRLEAPMFARWLDLWRTTTDERLLPAAASAMQAKAARISENLQLALQLRTPEGRKAMLSRSAAKPYKSTAVFDENSLPAALRRAHNTKPGVWGVIRVLDGRLRYVVEASGEARTLTPAIPGLVRPQELHHVEPEGPMRMRVEFYDREPCLI